MTDFSLIADDQWRERLSAEEYRVLRQGGTEAPHTGEYNNTTTEGIYSCRACGAELFRSNQKFASHCGWPSFSLHLPETPLLNEKIARTEWYVPKCYAQAAIPTSAMFSPEKATILRRICAIALIRSQ